MAENDDLPGEEWRPVAGFEDCYAVSNMGRLKRTSRAAGGPTAAGKILACPPNRHGYRAVVMTAPGGRRRWATLHRLVTDAFLRLRRKGEEINHIDGNKLNARLDNLEITDRKGNAAHAVRVLSVGLGSKNGSAKLTESDIPTIRRRLAAGESQQAVANSYGVSQVTVSRIHRGHNWSHS